MELNKHYLSGLDSKSILGFSLDYGGKKKPSAKTAKSYLSKLLPALDSLGVTTLYCADGEYFKKLTKQSKAEPHLGYVLPCAIEDFTHMNVIYGVNYQSLIYDPKNNHKLLQSLQALKNHLEGSYAPPGDSIIHSEYYPEDLKSIRECLEGLHQYPILTADFEAFSLFFGESGIGTVGFAWNKHEGVSFCCDYNPIDRLVGGTVKCGEYRINKEVRYLLRKFFEEYKGKLIWHNAGYDLKIAVYNLWMDNYLDFKGMLKGIEVMTKNFGDTKLLTYLATNSCAGNELGLKAQSHEYAGNYAEADINDITLIKKENLLRYNLVDCLCTWHVFEKHNPTVDKDNQRKPYEEVFLPCAKQILQMELVGMPIHMPSVIKANKRLNRLHDVYYNAFQKMLYKSGFILFRQKEEVHEYNTTRVKARKSLEDFKDLEVNPGSPKQIQHLLYDYWELPVLDTTDTGQPATGTKTLEKLLNHTEGIQSRVIRVLIHLSKVDKIVSSFMPNFLAAIKVSDGTHRLYGSFNLGGTKSGRLSSSNPNLQQIPSGSTFAKLIKKCFRAPPGYLFTGADYSALEDVVNSLLTKDPNKIAVWAEGYDGHCYRMVRYWPEEFTHIDINDVAQVNSTKKTHDALRGKSKAPSFAMQFAGTEYTLQRNCGFSPEEAKAIFNNYHTMYHVSADWTEAKLCQAAKDGYVTLAYGVRLRTPLMKKVVWRAPRMPKAAEAEGRTAGNAFSGQSYGLVNSMAAVMLQERINKSEYVGKIHISALIHDACYVICPNEVGAIKWLNDNLIECMISHNLPELDWHPKVKIGAELDIFYPSWAEHITLKNNISMQEIIKACQK